MTRPRKERPPTAHELLPPGHRAARYVLAGALVGATLTGAALLASPDVLTGLAEHAAAIVNWAQGKW